MASLKWAALLPAAVAGSAWLWGGATLAGPALSLILLFCVAMERSARGRFFIALAYYITGCWPIAGAVLGYWGAHHVAVALGAWWAAALVLAAPWALPPRRSGLLVALLLTALPPLGVIGWLSPLNAAGVLFPAMGW
ncbi:MAG: conjugal transfer protein TraB, partial [Burkholderiaceae bacterium]|nr:conjugal transfer protein TraB [Burkholderiaceae bacterium]